MSAPEDMSDREGLAAEYVLGTLPLPERLEAERLIASDADFAALVADWATRLAPLNDEIAEIAPPSDLLPKIEARLFPKARPAPRWRWPLMGAIAAIATALAFFWIAPILQPHDVRTATLVGENQPLVIQAAFDATDPGKAPAAWTWLTLVHSLRQIPDPVSDQRHREVVQVGDHYFADLPRAGPPALHENLHEVRLVHNVVVHARLALVGDAGELTAAVFVEDLRVQAGLDALTYLLGQNLGTGHDRGRGEAGRTTIPKVGGQEIEALGVPIDQHWVPVADLRDELVKGLGANLEGRDKQSAHEERIDALPHHLRL